MADVHKKLLGEWIAQFDMPIKYNFRSETHLTLTIKMQAPLDIEYKINTTQKPMHLDIHHTAGLLGVGIEKCIFELKEDGNVLVIASPLPTDDPERFGPRPLSFDCVTTVTFLRPGYEEVVRSRARDSVKEMTDNEQLYNFFKSTADLYDENVQGVRKIINLGHEGQSMEQLLMVQHLQIATKLRNIEMKYDRVFGNVKAIIEKGNASEYGDNVERERDRFMKNLQKMQNIQYALKLMAEQQERVQKQQRSDNTPSDAFDALPSPVLSATSSSSQKQEEEEVQNSSSDVSKTLISNEDKKKQQMDDSRGSVETEETESSESTPWFLLAGSLIAIGLAATAFLVINAPGKSASRRR